MKYAVFIKVDKLLMQGDVIMHELRILMAEKFPKRGVKIFNKKVEFYDQDADNFIKNLVTVLLTANVYKAPRIVTKQKHTREWSLKTINRFYR